MENPSSGKLLRLGRRGDERQVLPAGADAGRWVSLTPQRHRRRHFRRNTPLHRTDPGPEAHWLDR